MKSVALIHIPEDMDDPAYEKFADEISDASTEELLRVHRFIGELSEGIEEEFGYRLAQGSGVGDLSYDDFRYMDQNAGGQYAETHRD